MKDTSKALSRRERNRLRQRADILEAAREVLAEDGLEGLTIEGIAQRAEFSVGSIYRYFDSKEELIDELLGSLTVPFLSEVEEVVAAEHPFPAALDEVLAAFSTHAHKSMPALKLLHALPTDMALIASTQDRVDEARSTYLDLIRQLVEQGQSQGALDADEDAELLAVALLGMAHVFMRRASRGVEVDFDKAMAVVRRGFLHGFTPT